VSLSVYCGISSYYCYFQEPKPETIRPYPILQKTLIELKERWKKKTPYNWICNQFKSLRQDLTVRFGLQTCPVTKTTCIVVVEVEQDSERTVMGVIADAVNQVIDLAPKDIEEPPAFGTRVRLEYLFGMGKLGKKFALILNIDSVLSNTELLTVSTLQAEAVDARGEAGENSGDSLEA